MYEEDEWYIKLLKWLGEQIQKLLERYGWKKCIIAILLLATCLAISVRVFNCLWNKETDISVKPTLILILLMEEIKI